MIIFCALCGQEIFGEVYRYEGFPVCGLCKEALNINADTTE